MTSVSAGHIILTPAQPVGSGRPQRGPYPGPPHEESRALPTELPRPSVGPSQTSLMVSVTFVPRPGGGGWGVGLSPKSLTEKCYRYSASHVCWTLTSGCYYCVDIHLDPSNLLYLYLFKRINWFLDVLMLVLPPPPPRDINLSEVHCTLYIQFNESDQGVLKIFIKKFSASNFCEIIILWGKYLTMSRSTRMIKLV